MGMRDPMLLNIGEILLSIRWNMSNDFINGITMG